MNSENSAQSKPVPLDCTLPRTVAEDDEESFDQLDDEPDYPKDCFGCYAPGTEDCDWCEFADECAG
jgi:hypothetical protein